MFVFNENVRSKKIFSWVVAFLIMDLTQYIAPIFLVSFIFVTVSLYFMVAHVFMANMIPYAYLIFEVVLTIVMILIIMLHAQTINGDRLIQMSLDDFVLAALFLFHEFLITYAMTFYWQINHNYFTSDEFFWKSTSNKQSHGTTPINPDYEYGQTRRPPLEDEPWLTTSLDYGDNADGDDYPQIPKGRGNKVPRGGHGHRDPNEIDPMDRRRPNNRDSTIDWSVYHRKPSYGGGNRERARSKVPKPNHEIHGNRKPDDWDPEYITQSDDGEVPYDDVDAREFGKSVGSSDIVHQTTNEDAGPWLEFGAAEGKLAVGLG
ncbi:hypothetical protein M5D96_010571 [Drosophila gunungcola]|uniref:Uncharacterized protein n=1 Tax=Drosophila gunungcola TaxID=103775 RepID=A0A9Q0BM82_9MUSC|nr:hypothetical protein M5D96_010571 [Drosophila gunungcola]